MESLTGSVAQRLWSFSGSSNGAVGSGSDDEDRSVELGAEVYSETIQ